MVADSTNSGNVYNDGTEHLLNLARNLPIGNCQFDPTKGNTPSNEDWFPERGAHVNGERMCGAARQHSKRRVAAPTTVGLRERSGGAGAEGRGRQ